MATQDKTDFTPLSNRSDAPDDYEILTVYDMEPNDVTQTPPFTAKLFMSPEFTDEGDEDGRGKKRDYVLVFDYPDPLDNTVIKMGDCPTTRGSRIFGKYVEEIAEEKGYEMEREDIEDYL